MGLETPTSPKLRVTSIIEESELTEEPVGDAVSRVVNNLEMFNLPNKKPLTPEVVQKSAEQLMKQYNKTVQHDARGAEIKSEITNLLHASSGHYQKAQEILDKAPQEAAPKLAGNLRYLPEEIREEIARLALDKAPQEAAPKLAWNLRYLPEEIQVEIARLALDIAPQEAAPKLAWNLEYLPEEIREEIARLALDIAPQEAAPELAGNLRYLPEGIQVEIARLALDKAPQEAAPKLAWNLRYLPEEIREEIREEIENKVVQIVRVAEREKLSQAEKRNPVLYKDVDELDEQFLRKEFPKSGTKTLLLGKTLINNVILRIIPNHAFISWMNAYKAADTWKKAGFDYVPVEPIIKAHTSKDGKHTRVYSGVLGVSVRDYLDMYSNKNHHSYVREQVEKIEGVLKKMGITHGHTDNGNFCVLHERTSEGEIDWNKPPRVYCIDFDQSISS